MDINERLLAQAEHIWEIEGLNTSPVRVAGRLHGEIPYAFDSLQQLLAVTNQAKSKLKEQQISAEDDPSDSGSQKQTA